MGCINSKSDRRSLDSYEEEYTNRSGIIFTGQTEPIIKNKFVNQTLRKLGPFLYDTKNEAEFQDCELEGPFVKQSKKLLKIVQKFQNGKIYIGQWKDGERCGQGKQYWPNGSIYEGYWKNHKANGKGRLIHVNGDAYDGDWVDDVPQGSCIYYYYNGVKYEGEWYENYQHGQGVKTWPNGSKFIGTYKAGRRDGLGEFHWSDGSVYIGQFQNGEIQGDGECKWTNGKSYKGQWSNNIMHGQGEFSWPDGRRYKGITTKYYKNIQGGYVNAKKEGYGVLYFTDGSIYKGGWKNDKQHGKGIILDQKGHRIEGEWVEGFKLDRADQIQKEEQKKKELLEKAVEFVTKNEEVQTKIQTIFEKKTIVLNEVPQNANIDIDEKEETKKVLDNVFKGEKVQDVAEVSQALYVMAQQQQEKIQELLAEGKAEILTVEEVKKENTVENPDVMMYCLQSSFEKQGVTMIKSAESNSSDSQMNLHNIASFNSEENSAISLKFEDSQELSYSQLELDQQKLDDFLLTFKKNLAQSLNQPLESIKIYGIEKGSIKVICDVILPDGSKIEIDQTQISTFQEVSGAKVELKLHRLLSFCSLSPDNLCPKYNMTWESDHQENGFRGRERYYFPQGWKGYALNVLNNYGNNNNWLGMKNSLEEWPAFFHGTQQKFVRNIVEEGLIAGNGQFYENSICMRTGLTIGKGVYLSNHVEVAEKYTDKHTIDDKDYLIIFQVRVNPSAIRQVKKPSDIEEHQGDPDWDNDYFVVNQSSDIRPYRILLKKIEQQQ